MNEVFQQAAAVSESAESDGTPNANVKPIKIRVDELEIFADAVIEQFPWLVPSAEPIQWCQYALESGQPDHSGQVQVFKKVKAGRRSVNLFGECMTLTWPPAS